MKKLLIETAFVSAATASLLAAEVAPAAAGKPNIVFMFADDWGWGDLSCHGNTAN